MPATNAVHEPQPGASASGPLHMIMLPALRAYVAGEQIGITKKYLEGMTLNCQLWPGRITVLMQGDTRPSNNLDNVLVAPGSLPFELCVIPPPDQFDLAGRCRGASLVMASLDDYRQNKVSDVCRAVNVPCIYTSEYTYRTRIQSAAATVRNPLRRLRSYLWLWKQERERRAALRLATAVQCNGTPTYDAYAGIARDRLLYFDTRVQTSMLATEEEVERRCADLLAGRPLRLVFSGRLDRVKGADHLIDVAVALRRLKTPFHMSICGGGELERAMGARIAAEGLSDCVTMKGVLAFQTELVPFVKGSADLFVCCHRQGDPSCTYLETMACGVPIAGYANEALTGLVRNHGLGWTAPMDRPKRLAELIAGLHNDRESVRGMSMKVRSFAQGNTFELAFRARMDQMLRVANKMPS